MLTAHPTTIPYYHPHHYPYAKKNTTPTPTPDTAACPYLLCFKSTLDVILLYSSYRKFLLDYFNIFIYNIVKLRRNFMPTFNMTIGIPGCGKTTYCQQHFNPKTDIIVDSDVFREKFPNRPHHFIFAVMLATAIEALKDGKNVWYCATNLAAKHRIQTLNTIKDVIELCDCRALVFAVPLYICCARNANRSRVVPEDVIRRMMLQFQIPFAAEGWNSIQVVRNGECIPYVQLENTIFLFGEQYNPHHSLSLLGHSKKVYDLIAAKTTEDNPTLRQAAFLHDVGKPFAHTRDADGYYHYRGHECAGAYQILCCPILDLRVAQLVGAHMYPYNGWETWKKRIDANIIEDLELLHKADMEAH